MAGLLENGQATRKRENGQNRLGKCIGLYLSAENHPAWKLPHERLISFEHNAYNCQMLDGRLFVLFFAAATLLAVTPGPGIFYVLGRTLSGGKREGMLSASPKSESRLWRWNDWTRRLCRIR